MTESTSIERDVRHTASEVNASQVLGGRDGVSKHWTIGWDKLDDIGWQSRLSQDLIDGVAGRHGRVTGFPQHHVTLNANM